MIKSSAVRRLERLETAFGATKDGVEFQLDITTLRELVAVIRITQGTPGEPPDAGVILRDRSARLWVSHHYPEIYRQLVQEYEQSVEHRRREMPSIVDYAREIKRRLRQEDCATDLQSAKDSAMPLTHADPETAH